MPKQRAPYLPPNPGNGKSATQMMREFREKQKADRELIGPRNYQYHIGQNPPADMVEAFKKGVEYVPKPVDGFFKGKD